MTCISHNEMCFCNGGLVCYKWNLHSQAHAFIPKMEKLLCNVKNFKFIHWFYNSKAWGLNNEICVVYTAQCLQLCVIFTNNQHLSMSHSLMYAFPCWELHFYRQFFMLYYFWHCVHILHCCTCCFFFFAWCPAYAAM